MRYHRAFAASAAAAALITPLVAVSMPASAARQASGVSAPAGHRHAQAAPRAPSLPAPPRPPRSHPLAFLNDVLSTTHPVIWAADNVWQLTGTEGSSADVAFMAKYGWDPSQSYFDTTDNPATVTYKGETFTRNSANGANVLAPDTTNPSAVTVLGTANCTDTTGSPAACAPMAQTTGTSFPWPIRSANLTYVGEVPFSFISETDRYVAFSDLLFPALAPTATPSHLAMIRLEDVDPTADPAVLRQFGDYLYSQHVPFSVGVIPEYTDPNGYYNGGKKQTITLAQEPALVSALKYMQSKGGDSSTWAAGRATSGRRLFTQAGLSQPAIWETPHYFASAADYAGIGTVYSTRYEREIFPSGLLSGSLDYTHIFGQFFPYVVHDAYGQKIIPENLGNYEPVEVNNNPPRLPADIIHNAQVNLAVTQGVASFFFHPAYPPSGLQQTVAGIKALGYTFVSRPVCQANPGARRLAG